MKHFMFILLALILAACASSKKTTRQESAKTETSSVVEETKASGNAIVIDTTKSNDFTYTITQIEFFPPSGNVPEIGEKCNCIPKTMQLHSFDDAIASNEEKKPPSTHGAVKSWKQIQIGIKNEQKGKTEVNDSTKTGKKAAVKNKNDTENKDDAVKTSETTIPWYWYVTGFVLIGIVLFLIRSPTLKVFRKIFSFF